MNLVWGLFNLLPVYPLDGGQVSRELCGMEVGDPRQAHLAESVVRRGGLWWPCTRSCAGSKPRGEGARGWLKELPPWFPRGSFYTAILFGLLAYESYRLLQRIEWTDTHWDNRMPWER